MAGVPVLLFLGERVGLPVCHAVALATARRVLLDGPVGDLDRLHRAVRTQDQLHGGVLEAERDRLGAEVQDREHAAPGVVRVDPVSPVVDNGGRHDHLLERSTGLGHHLRVPAEGGDEGQSGLERGCLARQGRERLAGVNVPARVRIRARVVFAVQTTGICSFRRRREAPDQFQLLLTHDFSPRLSSQTIHHRGE